MKSKILEKILRRFEMLPLHFIGTNVFLEAMKNTKSGNNCASYLGRVGYNYRGVLCSSVLGEFLLIVLRDVNETEERSLMMDFMDKFSKKSKSEFSTLYHNSFSVVDKDKGNGF